jgi:hypothetical protein
MDMSDTKISVKLSAEQRDWLIALLRDQIADYEHDFDGDDDVWTHGKPLLTQLLATKGLRTFTVEAHGTTRFTVDAADALAARDVAADTVQQRTRADWTIGTVTDETTGGAGRGSETTASHDEAPSVPSRRGRRYRTR